MNCSKNNPFLLTPFLTISGTLSPPRPKNRHQVNHSTQTHMPTSPLLPPSHRRLDIFRSPILFTNRYPATNSARFLMRFFNFPSLFAPHSIPASMALRSTSKILALRCLSPIDIHKIHPPHRKRRNLLSSPPPPSFLLFFSHTPAPTHPPA